jgi:DNA adenine methylase
MATKRILHYPGSKWSMADWIISYFPEHQAYLEPFFGSGAIFFNKRPSKIETINDIDSEVVNLFKVIRGNPNELARVIQWTPLSREEYYLSYESIDSLDDLERARRFLVRCCQAIGAKTSDRTGWRSNIEPKNHHKAKEWNKLPHKIIQVASRLKDVQIESQPAAKLIKRYNHPEVLIYADPPYILETRTNRHYKHEMTIEEHIELLELLDQHNGPVILSGYDHELYNSKLRHWHRETKKVLAESGSHKEEVLWINPIAAEKLGQMSIFDYVR